MEDKNSEIRDKALEVAQAYEREQEQALLDRLMNEQEAGGLAVIGLEPTLESLLLGQVHTLVLDSGFQKSGYVCPQDRFLSTYVQTCPVCGQAMLEVPDLGEEMTAEAIQQGSEIEHIFQPWPRFQELGVGAFLRFAV
jgi:peptide chain release factor subunit 1